MLKTRRLLLVIALTIFVLIVGSLLFHQASKDASEHTKASRPLSHPEIEEVKATLAKLLEERDPKASLDYLRSAIRENESLARECHPLLHHVGRAAYEKYKDFNEAVSYQDGLCNSGYTHGVIEAHLKASGDINATLRTTCPAQGSNKTFQQWQCYHGLGHGVMYFTGKDLSQSITLCESLPGSFARGSCVNGVFMERFIIVNHSGSATIDTTDVETGLCGQQLLAHKPDCYFYAPTAYLERHTNDYAGAFEDCKNTEVKYIRTCIQGVGGQAMKENITQPEVAKDICKNAPKNYAGACVEGAISLLINHHASTDPAEPACSTVFHDFKEVCLKKIKAWNKLYSS